MEVGTCSTGGGSFKDDGRITANKWLCRICEPAFGYREPEEEEDTLS